MDFVLIKMIIYICIFEIIRVLLTNDCEKESFFQRRAWEISSGK